MSWIREGVVVAFAKSGWDITAGRRYTVVSDMEKGLHIKDDRGDRRWTLIQMQRRFREYGGWIVSYPPKPGLEESYRDTRTALIEALKARAEAVKDAPLHTPEASEQFWIGQALDKAYGIRVTVVPGPSTVTFTELANNP